MARTLSEASILAELRSRPCPAPEPGLQQRLLEQLVGRLDGSSDGLLKALAALAEEEGGGKERCTSGIGILGSSPDGEQQMLPMATSSKRPLHNLQSRPRAARPHGRSWAGGLHFSEPQHYFKDADPIERSISELFVLPLGGGTPDEGELWVAAHGDHRFHHGHADALEFLAERGGTVLHNIRKRERSTAGPERRINPKTLLDQLPVGIAKLDQEYRYTYLNDRAIASLKTSREHLLGRSVWEVYPEVAGTFVEDAYRSTMEEREVNSIELFFTPVNTWFDVESHPAEDGGIVVFFYDADPRKQTESDLSAVRQAEERQRRFYTTILNTTPDFAYIWGADHTFLYGNQALLDLFGLKEEEYVGRGFRDVGYPEWHARMHEQEIDEVVRTGKPLRGKIPFQSKGGGGVYDYIFMPIFGPDGKVEAIAGTTRDVTALENHALVLKEADKRKDEFLAVLAHELRNPLAPLRTGVELIGEDPEPEVVRQAHGIMARQIEHMVHLVDDLLDLSRVNRGAIELRQAPVRLRSVLETALEAVRPLIVERGHRLNLEFSPVPLVIHGDRTRLAQVFSNLLNNAAKYTDPGGVITLHAELNEGEARITVADTGIGIAEEDQPKVFEMFAQVDRKSDKGKGGLGIGLNIVQRLVQMHDGAISVASQGRGEGSAFTVTLPLADDQDLDTQHPKKAVVAAKPMRILIVDDNVDAAFVLSIMLKRLDHEVHATHGGEQAIELLESFRPEVVFLDIGMPGMDGYEVCRRMRATTGGDHCRIIALTGWGQEEDKARTHEAGFDAHLVKPTDKGTILRMLASFAGQ